MARKNESPQKTAMREMMRDYTTNFDWFKVVDTLLFL